MCPLALVTKTACSGCFGYCMYTLIQKYLSISLCIYQCKKMKGLRFSPNVFFKNALDCFF